VGGLTFLSSCISYWVIGIALLSIIQGSSNVVSFGDQWKAGLGSILPGSIAQVGTSPNPDLNLLGNVLIANIPQVVLSLVYVSYNGLFTCMLVSREWISYSRLRKGLRVQRPRGAQRETYWLSLPYRFSVPLLLASGFLHWFLSQSIFVGQINVYTYEKVYSANGGLNAIGWSALALTLLLTLGGTMILIIFGFGFLKFPPGMPVASSSSRAISAACHPTRQRESVKELQYGVISDLGDGKYHVGFSSGEVTPLVPGDYYE
jgi:hypothetical protein